MNVTIDYGEGTDYKLRTAILFLFEHTKDSEEIKLQTAILVFRFDRLHRVSPMLCVTNILCYFIEGKKNCKTYGMTFCCMASVVAHKTIERIGLGRPNMA